MIGSDPIIVLTNHGKHVSGIGHVENDVDIPNLVGFIRTVYQVHRVGNIVAVGVLNAHAVYGLVRGQAEQQAGIGGRCAAGGLEGDDFSTFLGFYLNKTVNGIFNGVQRAGVLNEMQGDTE